VTQPLADVDATAMAIAYLGNHPDVVAALGGSTSGRVAGTNRPPYPRIVITDPPGDDGDLIWRLSPALQVEVLGDIDGGTGKAALRKILYTVLGVLRQWPTIAFGPGQPVVTMVTPAAGGGWIPLGNGQSRYVATVRLTVHPPTP
jgi:hypothetical protein